MTFLTRRNTMNVTIKTEKTYDIYQIMLKFPMRYADEEGRLNRDHNSYVEDDSDGTPLAAILIDPETGAATNLAGKPIQDGEIYEKTCDENNVCIFYRPAGHFAFTNVYVPWFLSGASAGDCVDIEIKDGKIVGWKLGPKSLSMWIQEQQGQ
jgi:hypothetical protein